MNKPVYLGLSILQISKIVMYKEFGMITWNENMEQKPNYVTWIQMALYKIVYRDSTQKQKTFTQTQLKMLKQDFKI